MPEPWPGQRRQLRWPKGSEPRPQVIGWLVAACASGGIFYVALLLWTGAAARSQAPRDGRCATMSECRRAIDWWKAQTKRAARQRFHTAYPRLREASVLAGRAFGVDPAEMLAVARCESTSKGYERWVSARNGATAMGAWQWLDSTWAHSPFAGLDRRNVFTEAVATAWLVSRDGWRQWVCQP
jgi:hypothetical protein